MLQEYISFLVHDSKVMETYCEVGNILDKGTLFTIN